MENCSIIKKVWEWFFKWKIIAIIAEILDGNEFKINDLFSTEDPKNDINEYRDINSLDKVVNLINDYYDELLDCFSFKKSFFNKWFRNWKIKTNFG